MEDKYNIMVYCRLCGLDYHISIPKGIEWYHNRNGLVGVQGLIIDGVAEICQRCDNTNGLKGRAPSESELDLIEKKHQSHKVKEEQEGRCWI